jgi:class 3 adenylate cyclase
MAGPAESTSFLAVQNLAQTHVRRVRVMVLVASTLLVVFGVSWAVFFGARGQWLVVAWEVIVAALGGAVVMLVLRGQLGSAKGLLVFSLAALLLISALFLDIPSQNVPRSAHLAFIPLAVATYLMFKGENRWLQHGVPIFCLGAVMVFGSSDIAIRTPYAVPEEIRQFGGWVNNLAVFGILYGLIHIFIGDINRMEKVLHDTNNRLVDMVSRMFPQSIAERLLSTGETFAERYSHSTILFADIVGFTSLSERISPVALVDMLSEIFARFDRAVEMRGLTKIKTIGDAYMVATGVPEARADHARALVEFAREMFELIRDVEGLDLRIGIASGELVAGVIGQSRQLFDVWGDVVNMASRMESDGVPGRIQVSQATYELTRDWFTYERRGQVHIKGKDGTHNVYLLVESAVAHSPAEVDPLQAAS